MQPTMAHPEIEGSASFRYYAFISYKHKDSAWAHWLQRRLEGYRLPNKLIRDTDLPKRITPVFRDVTDLSSGGTVSELLRERLAESRYLIVICSRHMQVKPDYINEEINTFLSLGSSVRNVIPFIVDGIAVAEDPAQECLPPALLDLGENRPLGINATGSRRDGLIKLVAALLGLSMQTVKDHDAARRQRKTVAVLSSGLAASLMLGVFMAWQMLAVKQAQLSEQLTYAQDLYRQGNRIAAHQRAKEALSQTNLLMDPDISARADELTRFSAIHPQYAPKVLLETYQDGSDAMFAGDGQSVIIYGASAVHSYDMEGTCTFSFSPVGLGQKIMAVSADGIHCVILKTADSVKGASIAWLCDMRQGTLLAKLAESGRFDTRDSAEGNYANVLKARFSMDGSLVSAYCSGGYFNENDELAVWDVQTATKLFSLPADLLGTQAEGTQGKVIESFAFLGGNAFHWKGSVAHVFYTLGDKEAFTVPFASLANDQSIIINLDGRRYVITQDDQGAMAFVDLAEGKSAPIVLDLDEFIYHNRYMLAGGRYALLPVWRAYNDEQDIIAITRLIVFDLQAMEAIPSKALDATCHNAGDIRFFDGWESGGVYIALEDQVSKALGRYRTKQASSLIWFDPAEGHGGRIPLGNAGELFSQSAAFRGAKGRREMLLLSRDDGNTKLVMLGDGDLREVRVEEPFHQFLQHLDLSEANPDSLVSLHNGAYYLFSLAMPGVPLESGSAGSSQPGVTAVSRDGSWVAEASGTQVTVWRHGVQAFTAALAGPAKSLALSPRGGFLLAAGSNSLQVFGLDGSAGASLTGDQCPNVRAVKLSADGKRCLVLGWPQGSYAFDRSLMVYDTATLEQTALLAGKPENSLKDPSAIFDISPDGRYAAAVMEADPVFFIDTATTAVSLWSLQDGELLATSDVAEQKKADVALLPLGLGTEADAPPLRFIRFSAGGMLSAGYWADVCVWNPETLELTASIPEADAFSSTPLLMADGRLVYNGNGVHIWDTRRGVPVWTVTERQVDSMLLSDDERYLALGGAGGMEVYRTEDWSRVCTLAGGAGAILGLGENDLVYQAYGCLYQIDMGGYHQ